MREPFLGSGSRIGKTMPIKDEIAKFADDMCAWRRDIHAHPETAFEETRTSDIVAEKLR